MPRTTIDMSADLRREPTAQTQTGGPVARRYQALVDAGKIVPDEMQSTLVSALDALGEAIGARDQAEGTSWLSRRRLRRRKPQPLCGLYIWGGVGRGKTLLMDLFFDDAPTTRKRRVHFHEFMAEIHDRLGAFRKERKGRSDPIPPVARDVAANVELLCFDEFIVSDIADAMILGRLFEQLFQHGVIVVATTNIAPDDLYKGGINRSLFLPAIALIKAHMSVFHLDAPQDYRKGATGTEPRYATPLGPQADACLDAHFARLTENASAERTEVVNKGRRINVPQAAKGVARFDFTDLCSRPLGAGDYLAITKRFHTIILANIPILSPALRNEAKRMINLIDTVYDRHVRLIVSAEAEPVALWNGTDAAVAFEFMRTASRLIEMRSDAYWNAAPIPSDMSAPDAASRSDKKEARDD